jgi:isoleucyl-tRNA synthetase
VRLRANGDLYPLLERYASELPALFIVSQVAVEPREAGDLSVEIVRADGAKCERCWKYTTDIGSNSNFPTICASCADAVTDTVNE